jgi:hypothetical protein
MRRRLRLPEEQTVVHVRNRAPHFELMGQTLGGIFVFLLRQEFSDPDRARAFGRGFVQSGFCIKAHYCCDQGNLRGAS